MYNWSSFISRLRFRLLLDLRTGAVLEQELFWVAEICNFMTRTFSPPDSYSVLAELRPLTDAVWLALEEANSAALTFFEPEGRRWDAGVHAQLTRYHLIPLLDEAGLAVAEEAGDMPYERVGLANNGVCLIRGRHVVRVRKADDGRLPPPGSAAQEAFYAQQMSLPFNLEGMHQPEDPANFLILWGLHPADRTLNDLVLACPSATSEPHWYAKVEHPVTSLRQSTVAPAATADFDEIVPVQPETVFKQG
jgi:hypothetical protein